MRRDGRRGRPCTVGENGFRRVRGGARFVILDGLGGTYRGIYISEPMDHADDSPDDAELPLRGLRVVVTRPPGQVEEFARRLSRLGAEPVACPTIRIVPPEDPTPLREAASAVGSYDWVVLTSVNGAERLAGALEEVGASDGALTGARVAAIGPSTADRARERLGVAVDVVPEEYRAEALAGAIRRLAGGDLSGLRILLPRAAEARAVLPERLAAAGASVDEVAAYRAVPPDEGEMASVRGRLEAGRIDWVTFTASSTVRNFVSALGSDVGDARVAAIGPITAGTAREQGLRVDVEAEEYTIPGLVDALVGAAGDDGRGGA